MTLRTILIAAAAMSVIANRGLAQAPERYGHMMWGGGYGIGGALMMLVFWGLIIALIVFVVRWLTINDRTSGRHDDSLAILRERFAKGEIDEEEFDRRKRALGNK
ncbi:putative membrane protein [Salinihabitans flavidus]|uniref:Putative membrane protein n=1 Tax=Salinihabitans flavidus TaxID=569882 RepID=A0A1H8VSD1_9RHOB|nr:SHOCT domain-containing protein [Salinihabitans flavidus]SEP18316.1 putative membrane protein [Salinihabitans flavidus]